MQINWYRLKMKNRLFECFTVFVSATLLGGCVSASKVVSAGNGLYVIKGRAIAPWNADKERKKGLKKAAEYCAKQSRRVVLHNIQETGNAALLGEHATITFECET